MGGTELSNALTRVVTSDGVAGHAERMAGDEKRMLLVLDDGRSLVVPADWLTRQPDGSLLVTLAPEVASGSQREGYTTIPVIREELEIGRRLVETDRGVRVHKHVTERHQKVIQLLYRESLDVQRVPRNEIVTQPPPVRYEGTTMVVPLCEEVLVVEKRLVLKEEVRVTRREGQIRHAEDVALRSEHVDVERFGDGSAANPPLDPDRATGPRSANR